MRQTEIVQQLLDKAQILDALQQLGEARTLQELLDAFKDLPIIKEAAHTSLILFEGDVDAVEKKARVEAVLDTRPDAFDVMGNVYTFDTIPLFWKIDPAKAFIIEDIHEDRRLNPRSLAILERLGVRSMIALALTTTKAHIGWLLIENQTPHAYSAEDVDFLQILTRHLAVAAQNHRLALRAQQRARQIETGAEISKITSSILDLNRLIAQAVKLIKQGFEFYYVGVFLVDMAANQAMLRAGSGQEGKRQLEAKHSLALDEYSMIGWCITNKQARIALDVGQDAAHFNNPYLPLTRSEMALPLISRNMIIGAVTIQSEKPSAFSNDDIASLQIMTDQLANAIVNSQLYQKAQQSTQELETLLEINRDLSASMDLTKLLDLIVHKATDSVKSEHGAILLADGDVLIPRAVAGDYVEQILAVKVPVGQGASGLAAKTKKTITKIIEKPEENKHFVVPDTPLEPEVLVAVPIQSEARLIGVLLVRRLGADNAFSGNEVKLLEGIAQQAAIAVENAGLFAAAQESKQQYLAMVNNIPGAVYRAKFGETYAFTYVSNELFEITGYPVKRFFSDGDLSILSLMHPEDRDSVRQKIRQDLEHKQPYEVQYRIFNQNGQIKYVLERGAGVFDAKERLLYIDGILFDVTNRALLEQSIQRRAAQFEAVAQVGQKASAILDIDRLLNEAVNIISDTFNFYYAAIFLLDKNDEWAIFHAGSGSAGKKLLEQKHRLKKDEHSMVGWVTCHGEARVALNVDLERHRFDNPHLPLTRSEMALPLTSRDKVIGALDVQSVEENAFSKEDVDTLQLMANQLANVIENARFFKFTQSSLYYANLLYHTTQTLLETKTEDELFKVFIETLSRSDIDTVSISLYGGPPEDRYFEVKEIWDRNNNIVYPKGTRLNVNASTLSRL
ncbi:MAG TPA: GAF domain-containing protein, partial [Chloroflexi bacterium]|nr:GAF domain-containing protein [Chloroflexota bacterium]